MTIEERLEKLECELASRKRQGRVLLIAAIVSLTVGALGLVWAIVGTTTKGKVISAKQVCANKFILEDEKGRLRGLLSASEGGFMGLTLFDENSKRRVVLGGYNEEMALSLHNENGKPRVNLNIHNNIPELTLWCEDNSFIAVAANKDTPILVLSDENGKPRAAISMYWGKPSVDLYDRDGNVLWSAP